LGPWKPRFKKPNGWPLQGDCQLVRQIAKQESRKGNKHSITPASRLASACRSPTNSLILYKNHLDVKQNSWKGICAAKNKISNYFLIIDHSRKEAHTKAAPSTYILRIP
jgi:hypothetical protein